MKRLLIVSLGVGLALGSLDSLGSDEQPTWDGKEGLRVERMGRVWTECVKAGGSLEEDRKKALLLASGRLAKGLGEVVVDGRETMVGVDGELTRSTATTSTGMMGRVEEVRWGRFRREGLDVICVEGRVAK